MFGTIRFKGRSGCHGLFANCIGYTKVYHTVLLHSSYTHLVYRWLNYGQLLQLYNCRNDGLICLPSCLPRPILPCLFLLFPALLCPDSTCALTRHHRRANHLQAARRAGARAGHAPGEAQATEAGDGCLGQHVQVSAAAGSGPGAPCGVRPLTVYVFTVGCSICCRFIMWHGR